MTDLTPITALGAVNARQETYGALTISEECDLGLASLTLRTGQTAATSPGFTLPDVGKFSQDGDWSTFWSAPNQWMIMSAGQGTADFAAKVKAQAPMASVTEQTDGFAAFWIKGEVPKLEQMMSKLVNLPVGAYATGCAARTGLEHMTVFLVRPSEEELLVLVPRSYAGSLWHALETAARRVC